MQPECGRRLDSARGGAGKRYYRSTCIVNASTKRLTLPPVEGADRVLKGIGGCCSEMAHISIVRRWPQTNITCRHSLGILPIRNVVPLAALAARLRHHIILYMHAFFRCSQVPMFHSRSQCPRPHQAHEAIRIFAHNFCYKSSRLPVGCMIKTTIRDTTIRARAIRETRMMVPLEAGNLPFNIHCWLEKYL